MDLADALVTDLEQLTAVLDQPPRRRTDLTRALQSLDHLSVTAIGSFLGVSITLRLDGQEVTLTSVADSVLPADLRSSLRIPLAAVAPGLTGVVVFYAGRAGALDDLAAELRDLLFRRDSPLAAAAAPVAQVEEQIRLEELTPGEAPVGVVVSGISGARELSAVNRAVGLLIGRGHTAEEARSELSEMAARAHVSPFEMAELLLQRPGPAEGGH